MEIIIGEIKFKYDSVLLFSSTDIGNGERDGKVHIDGVYAELVNMVASACLNDDELYSIIRDALRLVKAVK